MLNHFTRNYRWVYKPVDQRRDGGVTRRNVY